MSGAALRSVARLQFCPRFTLSDAISIVPYLARLGVSHVYASPLLAARHGSTHGYDVVDHARINPELGGRAGLERLAEALVAHEMGIILDIVPNHMATDARENTWWRDVLACGEASRYARFFDVDWHPPDRTLAGKVLLPVLGRPYDEALRAGEITLVHKADGTPEVAYFAERWPISASSDQNLVAAAANDRAALDRLLGGQHYRLAFWKAAGNAINWRRFFDLSGLVALNVERRDVFAATHALILELFGEGIIEGVRVDHVDGLADPALYCRRLRRALTLQRRAAKPIIIVEKVLASDETLRRDWRVDGSTGYDFMNEVAAVLHDPRGAAPLTALWQKTVADTRGFEEIACEARRTILEKRFGADLARVVRGLRRSIERGGLGISDATLRRIVTEIIAQFRVYRTYASRRGKSSTDAALVDRAIEVARSNLCGDYEGALSSAREALLSKTGDRAVARFQQLTATVAAKGVEDTAFYRYGRLLSRNEVGSDPSIFSMTPNEFHRAQSRRGTNYPASFLATATHDQKRGEDVRARLAVLSEIPEEWASTVANWTGSHAKRRTMTADGPAPSAADELMLYQTLVGAWPATLEPDDEGGVERFCERVAIWQRKAIREAKLRSDWFAVDADYENACERFLRGLLEDRTSRCEIARFARRIGPAGAINGLAQTMLRVTVPGVPDLYQGTEFWDENLVDPDNRRPVDYALRAALFAEDRGLVELIATWRDGRIKQALIGRMLALRAQSAGLFARGSYQPLAASGGEAGRSLFFMRADGGTAVVIGVVRLSVPLLGAADVPEIPGDAWQGAALFLPAARHGEWRNVLDASPPLPGGRLIELGRLFDRLPVACWLDVQPI